MSPPRKPVHGQQCASFRAPRPVCTACGPACAVYHDVGHTTNRPAAHFLQAGTFHHAAQPVARCRGRCTSRRRPALRHTHILSAVLYRRAWAPAPTGRRDQPFCREIWKEWARIKNYWAKHTSTSEVHNPKTMTAFQKAVPACLLAVVCEMLLHLIQIPLADLTHKNRHRALNLHFFNSKLVWTVLAFPPHYLLKEINLVL